MTDSAIKPSCEEVEKLLAAGPLGAREISALLRCSLKQTMSILHCCWWPIQAVAWDGPGFRYKLRRVVAKHLAKPAEKAKEYQNTRGTMIPGMYH